MHGNRLTGLRSSPILLADCIEINSGEYSTPTESVALHLLMATNMNRYAVGCDLVSHSYKPEIIQIIIKLNKQLVVEADC